jgi:hypothetical protein
MRPEALLLLYLFLLWVFTLTGSAWIFVAIFVTAFRITKLKL